jgi:iron complex transport system substrate-binding protein
MGRRDVFRSTLSRLAFGAGLLLALTASATARTVVDSAGRTVEVPDAVTRVFAAGSPASTMLYVLAPEKMIGWVSRPRAPAKPYLLPTTRDLPELGRLSGRGDTLNLERLIAAKPDLVVDFGTINETYRSLAERVQQQTGIPYLLIDGRFANTLAAFRLLAGILGVKERGEALAQATEAIFARVDRVLEAVPDTKRPKIYLARGPEGLESGSRGSINTEIIERVGGINVVTGWREKGGIVNVSPEQLLAWQPDIVVTMEPRFASSVADKPVWAAVPAVAAGRVYLAPTLPFGFIDGPPSVNRLVGLVWLLHAFYPDAVTTALHDEVRAFYRLFYQVDLDADALTRLLDQPKP